MKSRGNFLFLVFSLCLIVGWAFFFKKVQEYYSPEKQYLASVKGLKKSLEKERLKTSLAKAQLEDFQISVASVLPHYLDRGRDLPGAQRKMMRSIASVTVDGNKPNLISKSQMLIEEAKSDFRDKKYDRSNKKLTELIETYPTSPFVVEAHFLLVETMFKLERFDECLKWVDQMMVHFPTDEMTGYGLLRMGQVFALRNQESRAGVVFSTIKEKFAQSSELKNQADKLEKKMRQ